MWMILVLLFSTAEAREVSIVLDGNQTNLVLANPSTVTVNYNITCHRADGSSTLLNLTNQNLAPNTRVVHTASVPDSGKCAANANPDYTGTDASGKPYYFCAGSNTYVNANNACGVGNTFCFPDLPSSVFACGSNSFWLKNEGSIQYAPNCGTFGAVSGGNQVVVGNFSYSGQSKKTAATSSCTVFFVSNEVADSTNHGAVCCSAPVTGSVCKITINTTNTNAYLSSPSFMGGAAF